MPMRASSLAVLGGHQRNVLVGVWANPTAMRVEKMNFMVFRFRGGWGGICMLSVCDVEGWVSALPVRGGMILIRAERDARMARSVKV